MGNGLKAQSLTAYTLVIPRLDRGIQKFSSFEIQYSLFDIRYSLL